ncbi:GNAT family N-acetyltransferase [Shewanella algae]|uniref:GNAT family N-acetyltransferase n=1 Tax=Shewanella algae TaxID=38313 RepID=UPI001AAD3E84|nr:GNAT family N-acetyltransferase [Shewanella algae]MBO2604416.1 GNAT family N-acetyltransferase [Shewanella algae]
MPNPAQEITVSLAQSPDLIAAACALVDSRDDNAHPLDHQAFMASRAVIVAQNGTGELVGCAVIKAGRGDIAELGYLMVHPEYRRRGIAAALTRKRIQIAREMGIRLLFATVREENRASRDNLLKSGMQFWGNYLSIRGTGNTVGWYFLVLAAQVDVATEMLKLVGDRVRID